MLAFALKCTAHRLVFVRCKGFFWCRALGDVISFVLSLDVLRCATDLLKPFPGSSQNPIAMYGIDFVIAQSQLQPLLLGATANPRFGAVDSFDSMIRVMAATKPATACEQYDDIVQIL